MSQDEVEETEIRDKSLPKRKVFRWLIKPLLYLIVFLMLSYFVSLIILNTSSVTSKFTKKLDKATGETWEIGSVFWVPFGNIYCNQLKTTQETNEAGGVFIDSISVDIDWSEIFSGEISWHEIQVQGGDIDIERSWLEERLSHTQQNVTIEVPLGTRSLPHVQSKVTTDTSKANDSLVKEENVSKQLLSKAPSSNPKKKKVKSIPDPVEIVFPNKDLKVSGVNIKIREKSKIWLEFKDLTMNIPLAGKQRNGSISVYGNQNQFYEVPVHFKENGILIEENDISFLGMNISLKLALSVLSPSNPFFAQIAVVEKEYNYKIDQPNLKVQVSAETVIGKAVVRGNAFRPKSWRGLGNVELERVFVKETQKTQSKLEFDRIAARGAIISGNLLLNYARAESDSLSFTSNGVITSNGYSYGVFRCIADNEMSEKLRRIVNGAKLKGLDKGFNHLFVDLETPDRKYFDVYLDGKLNSIEYKFSNSDEWKLIRPFVDRLISFKDEELAEDNLLEVDKN